MGEDDIAVASLQSEVILTFRHPRYVIPEGDTVMVTLESNIEIQMSFEIKVSTVDGTAEGEEEFPWTPHPQCTVHTLLLCMYWCQHLCSFPAGADYMALNSVMVTFEPWTSAVSVNITTIDDNVSEGDETLHVTFAIPSTEATVNIMRGPIDRAEVLIEANDGV